MAGDLRARIRSPLALLGEAGFVAVASLIASTTALLRDVSISKTLGRSQETDTLLAGLVVASTLAQLVPATFQASVFAVAVEAKLTRGSRAMAELLGAISLRFVALTALLVAPMVVFNHGLAAVIARTSGTDALAAVFPLLAGFAAAMALTELGKSVLVLEKRYYSYAVVGGLGNLLLAGLILLQRPETARSAAILAGLAFTTAMVVTWAFDLGQGLVRFGTASVNARDLRRIYAQAPPILGAGVLTIGMSVVDQVFTMSLGAGSYATLSFAQRWPLFVSNIPAVALGTVLLRTIAEDAVRLEPMALRHRIRQTFAVGFGLGLLATLGGLLFGPMVVRATLQGGSFTAADAAEVISVQNLLFWQAPFIVGGIVYLRVLNAFGLSRVGFIVGGFSLALNATLDWAFTRYWHLGVHGIALASVVVYALSGISLVIVGELVLRRPQPRG